MGWVSRSLHVNLVLSGIVSKLITFPAARQHLLLASQTLAAQLPPGVPSLHRVWDKLDKVCAAPDPPPLPLPPSAASLPRPPHGAAVLPLPLLPRTRQCPSFVAARRRVGSAGVRGS